RIGEELAARGPSEQYGNAGRFRILFDLGETIEGVVELVVVAVHEDQDPFLLAVRDLSMKGRFETLRIEPRNTRSHELVVRIARDLRGPLDCARLVIRRHGDADLGVGDLPRAIAGEQGGVIRRVAARRCHQDRNYGHAGHAFNQHRHHQPGRTSGTAGQVEGRDEKYGTGTDAPRPDSDTHYR